MKLVQIDVRNFRLLSEASIRIDKTTPATLLVGPNNSGKTSLAEALSLFSGRSKTGFTIYDFSTACWKNFDEAESLILEKKDDSAIEEKLPAVSMDLHFEYDDNEADLAVAGPLLTDLSEDNNVVRLRLSYGVSDPVKLARDFLSARADNQHLFDFLLSDLKGYFEMSYFKVSPSGNESERLEDGSAFNRLLAVDFVFAQRHIDDQEDSRSTRLSHLLYAQYEKHYKGDEPAKNKEIEDALRTHAADLGSKYMTVFGELIQSLRHFGYPQRRAPSISIRAELSSKTIFKDNTRIFYTAHTAPAATAPAATAPAATAPAATAVTEALVSIATPAAAAAAEILDAALTLAPQTPSATVAGPNAARPMELPEKYNGLGYKNLIYMILQMQSFRIALERLQKDRPRVHLIFIEEPETHLHPQVQSVFIKQISKFLGNGGNADDVQILVTTHSSHIVADSGFKPIRYFRTKGAGVVVKDLMEFEKKETGSDALRFLSKYMSLMRCDLFFATKAILIEGQVERLLLPAMIAECAANGRPDFVSEYITIVEVGGAHAHMFEHLLKFLEIPTLIITDLDSVDGEGKKCPVADGKQTSNATLKGWLPKEVNLTDLHIATPANKCDGAIRVAYQCAEHDKLPCARSFEEAFVYRNADWLLANRTAMSATSSKFNKKDVATLIAHAYGLDLPKVDFALDLIVLSGWATPRYIREGLEWLADCEPAQ